MTAVIDVIAGRTRDLGGFSVRRILPIAHRKTVGPFIFYDQMGPAVFGPGRGMDVRPHPHIGLATVTYLFSGRIMHRDSLGTVQAIEPGAVNWMTAGRGIVHSERTTPEDRHGGLKMHGIQSWVWLPKRLEECAPSFAHHPADTLPVIRDTGVTLRVIAGHAYGKTAPVATLADTLYVDAQLDAGARLQLPADHEERAVFAVDGAIDIDGTDYPAGVLAVLAPGHAVTLRATTATRVMLLGGEAVDGERHLWWNFVSSSPERIEQAKADWTRKRFPAVPGESEFIPLPAG